MITAGDFRKGITFEINGEPYVILDFQHVKPGKGAAFVRTKYKNKSKEKQIPLNIRTSSQEQQEKKLSTQVISLRTLV